MSTASNDYSVRITPRLVVGLGILAVGVLWTLDTFHLLDASRYLDWWPLILIAAGLVRFLDPTRGTLASVVLIVLGAGILLDNLDVMNFDLGDLFPLAVVLIGGKLVLDALGKRPIPAAGDDPSSTIHAFAIMAGVKRRSVSPGFRGGDASAIMGGVELDLRNAQIKEGEGAAIDTFALWGGVEIRVPENWRVVGKVMPLMGGFEDKTIPKGGDGPLLVVRGTAIMGAVEVKN
jgi:preprotein translocase subunit Sec61beta